MTEVDKLDLLRPLVQVVSAYVANNEIAAEALPELIRSVHAAFSTVHEDLQLVPASNRNPALCVRGSLSCGVSTGGRQDSEKSRLLRKVRSNFPDGSADLDVTSSTLASATDLRKKSSETGVSTFPNVQRILEGVSGIRRGRSKAFGG
jgi:hypothetical protein